jgi:endonuclease I
MSNTLISAFSIVVVIIAAFFLSSRFKLSSRYERKPETLNSWNRQDLGEDPSAARESS